MMMPYNALRPSDFIYIAVDLLNRVCSLTFDFVKTCRKLNVSKRRMTSLPCSISELFFSLCRYVWNGVAHRDGRVATVSAYWLSPRTCWCEPQNANTTCSKHVAKVPTLEMSVSVIQNVHCNYSSQSACKEVFIAFIVEVGISAFTFSLK
jgi:hypothetical protein